MRVPNQSAPLVNIPTQAQDRGLHHSLNAGGVRQQGAGGDAFTGHAKSVAAVAQGVNDLADMGVKIAQKMQQERDENDARDALVKLNEKLNTHLHGDPNSGDPGVYGRKGKDTLDSVPKTKDWFEKEVAAATQGMSKSAARSFANQAGGLRMSTMSSVARHEAAERKTWEIQSMTSQIEIEDRSARDNFTDLKQVDDSLARMEKVQRQRAAKLGLPPEATEEEVGKIRSGTLAGVFTRQVEAKNYDQARKLFDDPRISEDDKRKIADVYHRARLEDEYVNARKDPEGTKKRILSELDYRDPKAPQGKAAAPGAQPGQVKAVSLPAPVQEMAVKEAEAQGVPADLVQAVIHTESRGKDRQVSKAGARGLMQLMPETAKELGVNPDDPASNIKGGVKYLKQMLDRYQGDQQLALMAYNWGPGNVDAFIKTGKGAKGQAVPAETQNYVKSILGADIEGKDAPAGPGVPGAVMLADSGRVVSDAGSGITVPDGAAPASGSASAGGGAPSAPAPAKREHLLDMREADKLKVVDYANAEIHRRASENSKEAAVILHNKDNELAWAMEKGDFTRIQKMEEDLLRLGKPEAAVDLKKTREIYEQARPYLDASSNLPFAEQKAQFEAAFSKPDMMRPDNAAIVTKVRSMSAANMQKRMQAFAKDPAAYAATLLKKQAQSAKIAPEPEGPPQQDTPEQAARRNMALQEAMAKGMPGFTAQVLTAAQVDALKTELNDPAKDSTAKLQKLIGLSTQYGSLAFKAMQELELPAGAAAAANLAMDDGRNLVFARDLLAVSLMKDGEIPENPNLKTGEAKKQAMEMETVEFYRRMAEANPHPLVIHTASGMQDVSTRMVRLGRGESMKDFGKAYEYVMNDANLLRLPRHMKLDSAQVESSLGVVRSNIKDFLPEGFTDEQVRKVQQNGVWITTGDSQVALMAGGMLVTGRDGKPIAFPLSEAVDAGGRHIAKKHNLTYTPTLKRKSISEIFFGKPDEKANTGPDLNPEFWGTEQ